jgi:hypothetical protein
LGNPNPRPRQTNIQGGRPKEGAARLRAADEPQKEVEQVPDQEKKQAEEPEKIAKVTCFNYAQWGTSAQTVRNHTFVLFARELIT